MLSVVFDLDGTLADTSGDLIAAANASFARHGHSPPLDATRDYHLAHQGGRAMIDTGMARLGLLDVRWAENAYQELLWCYNANIAKHTRLYDGVERALAALQQRGVRLGICTNKPTSMAERVVNHLGIRHYFSALLGSSSLPMRKPDAGHLLNTIATMGGDPKDAVLLGDTKTDLDTAKNANIACVLVTFGPQGQLVKALKADAYLDHFDDLLAVIDALVTHRAASSNDC